MLQVFHGDVAAEVYPLGAAELKIGRSLDNDICLADASVSRFHARVMPEGTGYAIEDQSSTRGLFVNGQRAQRVTLQPGDVITLGDVTLRFSPPEEPGTGTEASAAGDVLLSVLEAINATHVLGEVMDRVVDAVMRLTGAERGFLFLTDDPAEVPAGAETLDEGVVGLRERASRVRGAPRASQGGLGISTSVLKLVMDRGQTVATGNAAAEPTFAPFESVANLHLRTIVCLPLRPARADHESDPRPPIGALYVDNSALSAPFRPEALRAAEALAIHAALAIENARLFEREQRTIAELEHARDQAQEASRAKSAFLANMSHELHTPLNAILNYAEMLVERAEDEAADAFLPDARRIVSSGKHLLRLIDDVLDLARLEEGRMKLAARPFEPEKLLREVVEGHRALADENQNTLELQLQGDLGEMESDPRRLRQILASLVTNALKFTQKGAVRVEAAAEPLGGAPGLRVTVSDTGTGIAPELAARLFEAFSQSDESDTRKHGGLGLGLAIASRLAVNLGGRIEVETQPGRGSLFTLRVPATLPGAGL
ncbi:MAG: ATP-binding protein [Vicinamibacteria bacterium]|nr:ATP-binding protein [Vicinamibacteria bacterium]